MAPDPSPPRLVNDPDAPSDVRDMVTMAREGLPDNARVSRLGDRILLAVASNVAAPEVDLPFEPTASAPAEPPVPGGDTEPHPDATLDPDADAAQVGPSGAADALAAKLSLAGGWPTSIGIALLVGGLLGAGIWLVQRGNDAARSAAGGATSAIHAAPLQSGATGADSEGRGKSDAIAGPNVTGTEPDGASARTAIDGDAANAAAKAAAATNPMARRNHGLGSAAATGSTKAPASRADEEAALLLSARSALSSNPAQALRLTQEHARRFPNGNLVQEREVIAIDALRRLGQTDAAQRRGAAFDRQYPGSVHRSKVEQTLKEK